MMYRQTKFSEILYKIREQLSQEANYDPLRFAKLFIENEKQILAHNEGNEKEIRTGKNENLDLIWRDDLKSGKKSA